MQIEIIHSNESTMLKPIGDRVLVKPVPQEEKTLSGIIIPDTAKEKPQQGKVVAVGDGHYYGDTLVPFDALHIVVGAQVMYKKHSFSAEELKIDGEELVILELQDILGVVETNKKK